LAYAINRLIGQCSIRSAGHGRVGLGAADPDAINDIIHLGTADAVRYDYSKNICVTEIVNVVSPSVR
jgi:hypothetical protein